MTASDRLTLEEEYNNQKEWITDDSSEYRAVRANMRRLTAAECTFIVFDNEYCKDSGDEGSLVAIICAFVSRQLWAGMVGDVNLFLHDDDGLRCAEVMVMIAEPSGRRKGFAKEAVLLLMFLGKSLARCEQAAGDAQQGRRDCALNRSWPKFQTPTQHQYHCLKVWDSS